MLFYCCECDVKMLSKRGCAPKKFRRLLFPALGGPNIAKRTPERTISPRRLSDRMALILPRRRSALVLAECGRDERACRGFTSRNGETAQTLLEDTLFDLFALPKVDQRLDQSEALDDFLSQFFKLDPRGSLHVRTSDKKKENRCFVLKFWTFGQKNGVPTYPHRSQRCLALAVGLGINKVLQTLDLRQVESPAFEGAARELARFSEATEGQVGDGGKDGGYDSAPGVDVQFNDVFCCK